MKLVKYLIKKIVYSAFLLYGYNLIAVNFNMIVPINVYSMSIVSVLGSFGLISLVLFKYLILWGFYGRIINC